MIGRSCFKPAAQVVTGFAGVNRKNYLTTRLSTRCTSAWTEELPNEPELNRVFSVVCHVLGVRPL
jgi:hypothetical protein